MHRAVVAVVITIVSLPGLSFGAEQTGSASEDQQLAREVGRLVRRLDDDRASERQAAEEALLELAGTSVAKSDRFLSVLPEPTAEMPVAVRGGLSRIRKEVEERVAKAAVEATTITLSADAMPLSDVIAAIEKQTGNNLVDQEDNAGARATITIDLKDEPFWSAIDQILDQAARGVYNYGGENSLMLVPRPAGDGIRHGDADYDGPFRIEVLEIQSQRSLRSPDNKSLRLQLEVAWEPRLRPIAISQPVADLKAVDENGAPIAPKQPEAVLDVEVPNGTQATELILPFELPPRDVSRIASLSGRLTALVPGRIVEFHFDDLANAAGKTERLGGVQVTVDNVRKNNAIWEVHMRLRLDEDNRALESHRGWVFQNVSYLVDKDGEHIDNAGFETTRQTPNEVGIAYLFDLSDGIERLTWVYETPAAIIEMPVEYELKDIELP